MAEKDLKYLLDLNYNVTLRKSKGRFYAFVPELSIIAEGETPNEAIEKLEEEKTAYFAKLVELDARDTIVEPIGMAVRKNLLGELPVFFVKACIVGFILAFLVVCSQPIVDMFIVKRLGGAPLAAKVLAIDLSNKVDRLFTNLSEKEKAEAILEIRRRVQAMKPFIDEIKVLWEEDALPSEKPTSDQN